jgi:hypothetical protein
VTKDIDAYTYAGVSRDWYYDELKKNPVFRARVEQAKTERKMRALAIIMKAAKKNWSAAGWFLERTYQDEFALKTRHEIGGPGGRPIPTLNINVPELPPEMMKKLAAMVIPEANGSNGNGNGAADPVAGAGA